MNILYIEENVHFAKKFAKELLNKFRSLELKVIEDLPESISETNDFSEVFFWDGFHADTIFLNIHGYQERRQFLNGLQFAYKIRRLRFLTPILIFAWFDPLLLRIEGFEKYPHISSAFSNSCLIMQYPFSIDSIKSLLANKEFRPMHIEEWEEADNLSFNLRIYHRLSYILQPLPLDMAISEYEKILRITPDKHPSKNDLLAIFDDLRNGNQMKVIEKIQKLLRN